MPNWTTVTLRIPATLSKVDCVAVWAGETLRIEMKKASADEANQDQCLTFEISPVDAAAASSP